MSIKENNNNENLLNLDQKDYLPKLLYLRLSRRKNVYYFCIYYFFLCFIFLIFCLLFFNATYVTRNYIINPQKFWEKSFKDPFLLRLQRYCALLAIYILCSTVFAIMLNIVILLHIVKGGLKRRLQFSNYIFYFSQIVTFIVCLLVLIIFKDLITLIPIIFTFSLFNLFAATIYFMLLRRSLKRENLYLLSLDKMKKHKEEYKEEYLSKIGRNKVINHNYK